MQRNLVNNVDVNKIESDGNVHDPDTSRVHRVLVRERVQSIVGEDKRSTAIIESEVPHDLPELHGLEYTIRPASGTMLVVSM